ncbi:OmpP1/FadL family transporter [Tenacibaculum aquimarinum]|uniref:OmpP1/FadL family transporter n=1 Tax=Tenacibaculum aquimarinum TaxID=2910675 RepID=UPI001F0B048A|nr:outer membrane protein transport protein [Tenacibaculum aquimarinum]MCH3881912.1 outer membrane protein transport protein [Tenacibaculum aquimarinum]
MKRFLTFAAIVATAFTSYSQSLDYNDLGILFGQDNNYGTSRFNAMSGAFGALGGDVSSTGINPAGAAVANNSMFSVTLGNKNNDVNASYYGTTFNTEEDYFNISQAGGILVFDTNSNSGWSNFALSFNYRLKNNFESYFGVDGNSGEAYYNIHPNDNTNPQTEFNNAQEQRFENYLNGESTVFTMGVSAAHENKLFIGAAVNIHDLRFGQTTYLDEINQDTNGNDLTILLDQNTYIESNGFSLSAGFIYKLHQNFRIGLAYETPTWYNETFEDYYEEYSAESNGIPNYSETIQELVAYSFRTPGKLTASSAIIFDKQGLISLDYTYKDYSNTKFTSNGFNNTNQDYKTYYKATHAVNIGTEWRFDRMSLRAGYHYEQSPIKDALDEDNLSGYSAGLGYNFGKFKFDLAYRNSGVNAPYSIYNSATISPIELNTNNTRITGTLTFNL